MTRLSKSSLPQHPTVFGMDIVTLLDWQEEALFEFDSGKSVLKVLVDFARRCEKAARGKLYISFVLGSPNQRMWQVVGDSLPTEYRRHIEAGESPHSQTLPERFVLSTEPVFIPDIAFEPVSTAWREVALANGLRGLWSWPIRSGSGQTQGAVVCHLSEPLTPTDEDKNLLALVAQTARLLLHRQNALNTMKDAQERHRQIFDSATDFAIIATDLNGVITDWNEGACRVLGWTGHETLGFRLHRIFTPEDVAANQPEAEMRLALQAGHSPDERWHLRKSGERFMRPGR